MSKLLSPVFLLVYVVMALLVVWAVWGEAKGTGGGPLGQPSMSQVRCLPGMVWDGLECVRSR